MTSERLAQIRQSIDHNPRGADGYVDELLRAVGQYIRDSHALRGALTDAEQKRDAALAEVERLRGIVEVNDQRLAAVWDEARVEVERLRDRMQLVADDIRHEASARRAELAAPRGGQSCGPRGGPLAGANPGVVRAVEFWAKALEEVLKPKGGA